MEGLSILTSLVLYALYYAGLLLAFSQTVDAVVIRFKLRRRLTGPSALKKTSLDPALARLLPLCALVFMAGMVLSAGVLRFFSAVFISAAAGSIPVLVMLARRGAFRRKAGKEGIAVVTELYRQYRMKDRNIYEAIDAAVDSSGDFPACRRQLALLLARLRDAGSKAQVIKACGQFSRALGTLWGRMLASCIEAAAVKGTDISEALSDIAEQLGNARKLAEERKRLNSEAARMSVFLVPALYAGTMLVASHFLGVSPRDLLVNQFASPEGLMLLVLSVFLFLVDLIILQSIDSAGTDY